MTREESDDVVEFILSHHEHYDGKKPFWLKPIDKKNLLVKSRDFLDYRIARMKELVWKREVF